jgi:glycine betaine/proline transport system permease protein
MPVKVLLKGRIKRSRIGTICCFGLLLIWAMGYWDESIQTTTLVIVSTLIALIFGVPLGIVAARSKTADVIIRPILDLMQTMPAFVYLIPAIFFLV